MGALQLLWLPVGTTHATAVTYVAKAPTVFGLARSLSYGNYIYALRFATADTLVQYAEAHGLGPGIPGARFGLYGMDSRMG
eukprot:6075224-Amphidinium_carterae.1